MLLTRHPWLDTYWQERVKNPFVDFVWYRRFTLQISGLLSRASVRFLIFIKYEKKSLHTVTGRSRSANRTRLSVGNLLLPPYRPAPVADGGVHAAFSSLWSALPPLRVRFG